MNNVLKVGVVGAPQSGKTSLIEYLRNYLKEDYQVIIAEEVPTRLLKAGLNPPYNLSGLQFQLECLKEYTRLYQGIDYNLATYLSQREKPVVILYDTVPLIGQCYLGEQDSPEKDYWSKAYEAEKFNYSGHDVDVMYITELLRGEYSPQGNAVRRELDVENVLSISDSIDRVFEGGIHLSNTLSIEERANIVAEEIDARLKSQKTLIKEKPLQ